MIAYKIVFSDSTEETEVGDWHWPAFDMPTSLPATVGQTLADVTLPTVTNGTWAWEDSTVSVGEEGTHTFNATFTPIDSSLYTITNIAVPVAVNAPAYTVTFDANGGTGTMAPQTISGMTELNPNAFIRSGYIFTGWNTAADGTGTSYEDGFYFIGDELTSDTTLYAQWIEPNVKVGAVFKAGDSMVFGGTDVILKIGLKLCKSPSSYVAKINTINDQLVTTDHLQYKTDEGYWSATASIGFSAAVPGADCVKITSGSGTESDPYIVELAVYKLPV